MKVCILFSVRDAQKTLKRGLRSGFHALDRNGHLVRRLKAPIPRSHEDYASQRPTMLPKIGSANGDAIGSQLGSSAASCKTDLTFRRLLLRSRLTYWDWLCRVASAKT
jgi:hypothetical protein